MGRLTAHLSPEGRPRTYLTDPAGDRLNARALETTGQEGQWQREGEYDGTHYRFDRAGNLVLRAGVEGDTQFIWDAYQRLAGTRTKTATTTYCYDPFGRRIRKQTGDTTIHFCWDGDLLLGDAIVSGELGTEAPLRLVREWVPYPDTYEQLAQVHLSTGKSADNAHNSILYYYHNDPNGCPTRLLDAQATPSGRHCMRDGGASNVSLPMTSTTRSGCKASMRIGKPGSITTTFAITTRRLGSSSARIP